eukprot:666146-Amphidinium_carterae.1
MKADATMCDMDLFTPLDLAADAATAQVLQPEEATKTESPENISRGSVPRSEAVEIQETISESSASELSPEELG